MNIWSFLKDVFKQNKKAENDDLNTQIENCAKFLVKQNLNKKKLDYSLSSLKIIDQISKSEETKQNRKKHNECSEFEKIACYILMTLKNSYKGEIIWNDIEKQPIFIFQNFKEFHPYKYVEKLMENNGNINSQKYISELEQQK